MKLKRRTNDNFKCLWQKHFIHVNVYAVGFCYIKTGNAFFVFHIFPRDELSSIRTLL